MKKGIFKKIFYIVIGIIIGGVVAVEATTAILAQDISYSHEATGATTVSGALDELLNNIGTSQDESVRYYLYDEGNEYTEITGGWGEHIGANGVQNVVTGWLTKEDRYMEINTKGSGSYYKNFTTNNKIDLKDYVLVGVEYLYTPSSYGTAMAGGAIIYASSLTGVSSSGNSNLPHYWITPSMALLSTQNRIVQYYKIDDSARTNGYLGITHGDFYSGGSVRVHKIWLQK